MQWALAVAGALLVFSIIVLVVVVQLAKAHGRDEALVDGAQDAARRNAEADRIAREPVADEAAWLEQQRELARQVDRARSLDARTRRLRDHRDDPAA